LGVRLDVASCASLAWTRGGRALDELVMVLVAYGRICFEQSYQ